MVGSAIMRNLIQKGYNNIVVKTSAELDLKNQAQVETFFNQERPKFVFLAAAKVGGIYANNTFKAEFIFDNLMIQSNVIHSAYINSVKKLLFLGSSCIYPKLSKQPIKEDYLLSGYLENTNKPYAIAKIAGVELCKSYRDQYGCNFVSVMPTNLYGPNDNYDHLNSHVIPALIKKFVTAKKNKINKVVVWGTGKVKREFLHVNDLAEAIFFVMKNYDDEQIINIGTGKDVTIFELANLITKITGFEGEIIFDSSKPDGTPRKLLDISLISELGWFHKINLNSGLKSTIDDFIKNYI